MPSSPATTAAIADSPIQGHGHAFGGPVQLGGPPQAEGLTKDEREALQALLDSDPVCWMEKNFYIPDPRDPITGQQLPPGPIRIHPVQKKILRAALTKRNDRFQYATIVYSTIKKSGKTRIAAGVAAWFAATQGAMNEIYCLANDGKQSADRILSAIKQAVLLNPKLRESWKVTQTAIRLPNGTFIEAIPCDPKGSAGANPGLTVWSEMWGFSNIHKERLWSEMTIPPTRWGRAFRWVESYAGYVGESNVLYDLYDVGKENGRRHRAFLDPRGPPIYYNEPAKQFTYWDEGDVARRMPWQLGPDGAAYYLEEATTLMPSEFDRIHRNMWIEPIDKAIPIEWWDACMGPVPPLGPRTPIVVAVDASVSGDCSAMVAISRHPSKKLQDKHTMVRMFRAWEPPAGGKIDLTETIETTLLRWISEYNVVEVAYDEYQLHKMMTDLRKKKIVKLFQFSQQSPRAHADKQLCDMIRQREIHHDGNAKLRTHVDNAAAKTTGEKYRFVKMEPAGNKGRERRAKRKPIDGLVATSMGSEECLRLRLT